MRPGAFALKLRQKFSKGLMSAYYRDVVRPRILRTPPIAGTTDGTAELHVMTRSADWLDLIWALKSFYIFSGKRYKLAIHDDGSLGQEHREAINRHFPDCRLIDRTEADERICAELAAYPRNLDFRRTNILAPKVFDFISYLDSDRMIIFDSDLMFFSRPTAILDCIEDKDFRFNTFNSDCKHCYTVEPDKIGPLVGHAVLPQINSGFGLIHRDSMRLDWTEEFLGLPGIVDGHFWRIEQTLIALCSSRYGAKLLPEEYTLRLEPGIGKRPFRHYVGEIRHLFYREGIRHLVGARFLEV